MTRREWLLTFLSDPGVLLAIGTLAVEVNCIVKLRRILADRAAFEQIVEGEFP